MIAANTTIDFGHDVLSPIIVGCVLFTLTGLAVWSIRQIHRVGTVIERVEGQVKPNGAASAAGTAGMTTRDAIDVNTQLTRSLAATLDDHVIDDERRFRDQERELAALRAVVEDRGTLLRAVLDHTRQERERHS